jgi:hypothetical protein
MEGKDNSMSTVRHVLDLMALTYKLLRLSTWKFVLWQVINVFRSMVWNIVVRGKLQILRRCEALKLRLKIWWTRISGSFVVFRNSASKLPFAPHLTVDMAEDTRWSVTIVCYHTAEFHYSINKCYHLTITNNYASHKVRRKCELLFL